MVKPDGPYKALADLMKPVSRTSKVSWHARAGALTMTALSMERRQRQICDREPENVEGFTGVMGGNLDAMPSSLSQRSSITSPDSSRC